MNLCIIFFEFLCSKGCIVSLVYTLRVCPLRNDIAFIQAKKDNLASSRKRLCPLSKNQTLACHTKLTKYVNAAMLQLPCRGVHDTARPVGGYHGLMRRKLQILSFVQSNVSNFLYPLFKPVLHSAASLPPSHSQSRRGMLWRACFVLNHRLSPLAYPSPPGSPFLFAAPHHLVELPFATLH